MSAEKKEGPPRPPANDHAALLLNRWAESLAQVLESMTDQQPGVQCRAGDGPLGGAPAAETEILWWEQPFQIAPDMKVWVGAPHSVWEYIGTLTLKAAGLETVETGEAKNTWLEILGQSLSGLARSIGSLVGAEVNCEAGSEHAPDPDTPVWSSVIVSFPEAALAPMLAALSPALVALTGAPAGSLAAGNEVAGGVPAQPETEPQRRAEPRSRTMELLLDVDLPVSISFGKAQLPMKDVLKLTTGSIVELNRGINDPVEVLVNHCLIARGEVVVVEGNYGVRIQEIASRHDRLRSIR